MCFRVIDVILLAPAVAGGRGRGTARGAARGGSTSVLGGACLALDRVRLANSGVHGVVAGVG